MTNVPTEIRDLWTGMYKLFDKYYKIDGSKEQWEAFYEESKELWEKSGRNRRVLEGIVFISGWISDRLRA